MKIVVEQCFWLFGLHETQSDRLARCQVSVQEFISAMDSGRFVSFVSYCDDLQLQHKCGFAGLPNLPKNQLGGIATRLGLSNFQISGNVFYGLFPWPSKTPKR